MDLKAKKLEYKDVLDMYIWTSSFNFKIKDYIKVHKDNEELLEILEDIHATSNDFTDFLDELNRFSTKEEISSNLSFNTFMYYIHDLNQKIKQYKDILEFLFIFNYKPLYNYVLD